MSFNDRVGAADDCIVEVVRRTPSGKLLPSELWPCHCLVCGQEMPEFAAVESEDGTVEITYLHGPPGPCSNTQRSILVSPAAIQALADAEKPRFPCPECGKETLEHVGPPGTRICCMTWCRHVIHP